MRGLMKQKKGQFIIIAVLFIAIMMISIGALLYTAVTYYKHEPWEEYLTLIGNIELSSRDLVELSLSNYTNTLNTNVLKTNLEQWQSDIKRVYPGLGVILMYSLPDQETVVAYGQNINYTLGLSRHWYDKTSFSAANATFNLNITSVGLTGYKFMVTSFLKLTIINVAGNKINVTVTEEDGMPVTNLKKDNFQVDGVNITDVARRWDPNYVLMYTITCETSPANATVRVWDQRGIQVIAKET